MPLDDTRRRASRNGSRRSALALSIVASQPIESDDASLPLIERDDADTPELFSPSAWLRSSPPAREWLIEDWLAPRSVTLLYGAGGIGKSLLGQQLATAIATGRPWCGRSTASGPVLGIFAEDDRDELFRRQVAINDAMSVRMHDLIDAHYLEAIGSDNAMIALVGGSLTVTDRFRKIRALALKTRARFILIDTVSDVFGLNENDRAHVSYFIKTVLNGWLARESGASVVVTAHPSRAGLATGALDGGSTAWRAGARAVWTLAAPPDEDGQPDRSRRILTRTKSNYSSEGEAIALRWQDGAFVPDVDGPSALDRHAAADRAKTVFLRLLQQTTEAGQHVGEARQGRFAPRLFADRVGSDGISARDFERAMARLLEEGTIRIEPYGPPSAGTRHLVRTVPNGSA